MVGNPNGIDSNLMSNEGIIWINYSLQDNFEIGCLLHLGNGLPRKIIIEVIDEGVLRILIPELDIDSEFVEDLQLHNGQEFISFVYSPFPEHLRIDCQSDC